MSADSIQFRCSSLGLIMADAEKDVVPKGAQTHLVDIFISHRYGRREDISSKFVEKGNRREEDSITLVSAEEGVYLKKNNRRLSNGFIQGEPDTYIGESITRADETRDTKTSWSMHTFLRAKYAKLDTKYYWQGMGYMWLTGAKKHTVDYCLVNGTFEAIMDEKRRLSYQPGMVDAYGNDTEECLKRKRQIEINHIFDLPSFLKEYPHFEFDNDINEWKWDVPRSERHHKFEIEYSETAINQIKARVTKCRSWMQDNLFPSPLVMLATHDPQFNATIIERG